MLSMVFPVVWNPLHLRNNNNNKNKQQQQQIELQGESFLYQTCKFHFIDKSSELKKIMCNTP